jgi:hypothetical protein
VAAGDSILAIQSTLDAFKPPAAETPDQKIGQEFGGEQERHTLEVLSSTLPGWVVANLLLQVAEHCQPFSLGCSRERDPLDVGAAAHPTVGTGAKSPHPLHATLGTDGVGSSKTIDGSCLTGRPMTGFSELTAIIDNPLG